MRPYLIGIVVLSYVCETAVLTPDGVDESPVGRRSVSIGEHGGLPVAPVVEAQSAHIEPQRSADASAKSTQGGHAPVAGGVASASAAVGGAVQTAIPDPSPNKSKKLMYYEHYRSAECQAGISERFSWAKYVIAFGFLAVMWIVVALLVRCGCGGPRQRATMVVFTAVFSIAWLVLCFASDRVLRRMFESVFRAGICPLPTRP